MLRLSGSMTLRLPARLAEPRSRRGQPLALHPAQAGELPKALRPGSSQETGACGTKARSLSTPRPSQPSRGRELPGATTWEPLTAMSGRRRRTRASTPPGSASRPLPGSCQALHLVAAARPCGAAQQRSRCTTPQEHPAASRELPLGATPGYGQVPVWCGTEAEPRPAP